MAATMDSGANEKPLLLWICGILTIDQHCWSCFKKHLLIPTFCFLWLQCWPRGAFLMRHQGSDLVERAHLHYNICADRCIAKLSWPNLILISLALAFLSVKNKLKWVYLMFFLLLYFQDCTGNSLISLGLHMFGWSVCVGNLTASKSNQ